MVSAFGIFYNFYFSYFFQIVLCVAVENVQFVLFLNLLTVYKLDNKS